MNRYEAKEGYVFDYAILHTHEEEDGTIVEDHIYAKILYLGINDDIDNYIEVVIPSGQK